VWHYPGGEGFQAERHAAWLEHLARFPQVRW